MPRGGGGKGERAAEDGGRRHTRRPTQATLAGTSRFIHQNFNHLSLTSPPLPYTRCWPGERAMEIMWREHIGRHELDAVLWAYSHSLKVLWHP